MKQYKIIGHTLRNLLHSAALFGAMLLIMVLLGYFFGGLTGILWTAILTLPFLILSNRLSPQLILRMYGARPLAVSGAPKLYRLIQALSDRANLPRPPRLYYIPSRMMNALTIGSRRNAALGITDGLLHHLTLRELAGVLAHEIAHIRDNDMQVMGFADLISRITGLFSSLGQLLLILNLPLILMGRSPIPWAGVVLLIAAPSITGLLQLALSRTREFQADIGAIRLTHDPEGLASALNKMERHHTGLLRRVLLPGYRNPDPSLFRTHPAMDERIRRLLELREDQVDQDGGKQLTADHLQRVELPQDLPKPLRGPHWHMSGLWH